MNEKIKAFIEKQKKKRTIEKTKQRLFNQLVYKEYDLQHDPKNKKEAERLAREYDKEIIKLDKELKNL